MIYCVKSVKLCLIKVFQIILSDCFLLLYCETDETTIQQKQMNESQYTTGMIRGQYIFINLVTFLIICV